MNDPRVRAITMPKWGMMMTEGRIAAWLKGVGDDLARGEAFVEVETDKITNVVEAGDAACGALIAVVAGAEVPEAEVDAFVAARATAPRDAAAGEAALRTHRIEAGGLQINVVSAPGDAGGVPVLMLHGFGSDAGAWMVNQAALAGERAVHALDLPSHGGSEVSAEIASVADFARVVAEAVAALDLGEMHLVGHSLGGRVALRLAAELGGRVRSLALIAPAGFGDAVNAEFLAAFITADRRRPIKAALGLLVADPGQVSAEMVERSLSYKRTDGVPQALAAIAAASFPDGRQVADAAGDLAKLDASLLVIWGAEDRILPAAQAENAAGHAKVLVIEGAGHMPQMEASARVNAALLAHIEAAE